MSSKFDDGNKHKSDHNAHLIMCEWCIYVFCSVIIIIKRLCDHECASIVPLDISGLGDV